MTANTPPRVLLAVSAAPFWHCGRTVRGNHLYMLLALLPALIMAVVHWGLPAVRVMALAVCVGVAVEAGCQKLMDRDVGVDDLSAAVSCLLLAFLLPATAPWWLVTIGAVLCITLGKMVFGGLGTNPMNTSLVGWAILYVSWPLLMDPNAMLLNTDVTDPLVRLKYFGAEAAAAIPLGDLLLGHQIGGLGAAQTGALLLGGLFLMARGIVRWEIPCGFFAGVLLLGTLFWMTAPQASVSPVFHLFTGSTILAGFFLATEPANSPNRPLPMLLYGLLGGLMVIVIRKYGVHLDGVPFAVLLANLAAPLLDQIRPKPFRVR